MTFLISVFILFVVGKIGCDIEELQAKVERIEKILNKK